MDAVYPGSTVPRTFPTWWDSPGTSSPRPASSDSSVGRPSTARACPSCCRRTLPLECHSMDIFVPDSTSFETCCLETCPRTCVLNSKLEIPIELHPCNPLALAPRPPGAPEVVHLDGPRAPGYVQVRHAGTPLQLAAVLRCDYCNDTRG